jgi:signal transduction histidine kinase
MRTAIARYAVASGAVAGALGLRMLVEPLTGIGAPWVVFFSAVVVASLYGGIGPGLYATALSGPIAAYFFVLPAGHTLSQAVAQALLFIADGAVLVYLSSLITRGRRLAEASAEAHARSEERLRLANEAARIGSYDLDVRSGTLVGSPELHELLDVEAGGTLRERASRAIHADDVTMAVAAYEHSLEPMGTGRVQLEVRVLRSDGSTRWLSWVGRTHFETGPGGRMPIRQVGAVVDITERRHAEAKLREEDRKKDEFLAMLSHELRNPLAAIRSSVHVLDRAQPGSAPARRAHGIIDRQAGQLTRLVDDLLDVTRIARGKLRLQREPVELGEIVRRTVDDLRTEAEARGNALELVPAAEPLWVDGDAARLAQIVGNLLHNAAKFTQGGRIEVSLGRDRGDVMLRVRDTGAGIRAEDLPRVFGPFVQLDSAIAGANGGLGLGLALVKGIVDLHGGSVVAASAGPGLGSEFCIRLPRVNAPDSPDATAGLETAPGRRVLVIEDNPDVAEALMDMLRFMGHDVQVAPDGATGIVAASKFHPDVVLCDIGLPGMSGYEVAQRMRADAALRGATLVALTGYGRPEDRRRAAEAGFARHVVKPATFEVLERALAG